MPAILTVICGPMFAGKSTALLREVGKLSPSSVMLLKPGMDTRYDKDSVVTHDGLKAPAKPVRFMPRIPENISDVFLDEVQFMENPWFEGSLTDDVDKLLARGVSVWAAGLDMDAWGVPFLVTSSLLAMSDHVFKLKSSCHVCGAPACMTTLKGDAGDRIKLGGGDVYAPACREHWQAP